eukprot:398529-Rhodomonas_salina.2
MDEFEKGHPEAISDLLLGAFDDSGSLKDMQVMQCRGFFVLLLLLRVLVMSRIPDPKPETLNPKP